MLNVVLSCSRSRSSRGARLARPRSWDQLETTSLLTRRRCQVCDEGVDYCMRIEEVRATLASGRPFVMDDQLPASIAELGTEPVVRRGCGGDATD